MSDGFPDRLTQLRARWQGDPSSRVFLQLAEEYRHLGRVQEALEVLQRGLQEHPGYLSALVAKGRCLLELGDAGGARAVLERVVQQDATQMVANKLLVRACLETGEPERAKERLDLYSLLNDSDPEIDELRRRVVAMSRPPQAADEPRWAEAAKGSPMNGTEMPAGKTEDVFDLGHTEPLRAVTSEDSVFDLAPPAAVAEAPHGKSVGAGMHGRAGSEAPAATPAAAAPREAAGSIATPGSDATGGAGATAVPMAGSGAPVAAAQQGVAPRGEGSPSEPFPDLAPHASLHTYLTGLAAEPIFAFEPPPSAAPAAMPAAPPAMHAAPPVLDSAPAVMDTTPGVMDTASAVMDKTPGGMDTASAVSPAAAWEPADPAGLPAWEPPAADAALTSAPASWEPAATPPVSSGFAAALPWEPESPAPAFAADAGPAANAVGSAPAAAPAGWERVEAATGGEPGEGIEVAEPGGAGGTVEALAGGEGGRVEALAAAGLDGGGTGGLATATLGELYLRQGHLGEAERIFQDVLHREPRNAVALGALGEIERRRKPLDAAALMDGHGDPGATLAARKAYLLRGYLTRLRQARRPHVP